MKNNLILLPVLFFLGGCVYAETPSGRVALLDLPVATHTTVNKTVTVNAPAGTIVNISETPIYPPQYHERCRWEYNPNPPHQRRRVCW